MTEDALWHKVALPEWDPERLFLLFELHRAPAPPAPTPAERDEYARQLMQLVAIRFRQKGYMDSLAVAGLTAEYVAADTVAELVRRTPRFRIDKPHYKVMLRQMNTAIRNLVVQAVRDRRPGEVNGTDYGDAALSAGDPIDAHAAPSAAACESALATVLRSEQAEDHVVGDVQGDVFVLLALYRHQRGRLLRKNRLVPYADLPEWLKQRVTHEQNNLVVARVRRLVYRILSGRVTRPSPPTAARRPCKQRPRAVATALPPPPSAAAVPATATPAGAAMTLKMLAEYFGGEVERWRSCGPTRGATIRVPPMDVVERMAEDGVDHAVAAARPVPRGRVPRVGVLRPPETDDRQVVRQDGRPRLGRRRASRGMACRRGSRYRGRRAYVTV